MNISAPREAIKTILLATALVISSSSIGCFPSFEPNAPGMSEQMSSFLARNYRAEHMHREGTMEGCDEEDVRLIYRRRMAPNVHEYELMGCGDLSWHVFTSCQSLAICTQYWNRGTLERSARFDLECEEEELTYRVLGGSAFGVEGCGKKATYVAGNDAWELASPVRDAAGTSSIAATAAERAAPPPDDLIEGTPQSSARAFVVGIERYRDLPSPTGARADAQSVAAMLKTTMGLTDERIRIALDDRATAADIRRGLRWLAETTPAGGRAYFYFSGHGAPAPETGSTYLVPYDGDPLALDESALPLDQLVKTLGAIEASETVAMIDSCFSGSGGRSVLPEGTRPLVRIREPKTTANLVVMTAATGAETSGTGKDGKRGLFTRYLVEALGEGRADIDGDAQITVGEVLQWVTPRVARQAKEAGRRQTPRLLEGSSQDGLVLIHGLAR